NVRRKRSAQRFCSHPCRQAALRSRKAAHALRSVTQGGDTEKRHATILKAFENQPVTRTKKQGRGSAFSVPVNVIGGDRQQWSGARLLEPALCRAIVHCEVGSKLCIGFVLDRGKGAFEAFDINECTVDMFATQRCAADAIFKQQSGK